MTSGDLTRTQGWNLQLQGRVRTLETDLAEAERQLRALLNSGRRTPAEKFLLRMAAKRRSVATQARAIDKFLENK